MAQPRFVLSKLFSLPEGMPPLRAATIFATCLLPAVLCGHARADRPVIAPAGCPVFHCTPEASGVIYQPLVQSPTAVLANNALGQLSRQGCSGDGKRLACLFVVDNVTAGVAKGTLKILDAATLQPLWGSGGVAGSYDINPATFSSGQVPVLFADGRLAAGDSSNFVLYDATGKAIKSITLDGTGTNMGMTLVSARYGVISQSTGMLTLVDLASWTKVSQLRLRGDGAAVTLVSPSSGSGGVLYSVAAVLTPTSARGYLFATAVGSDARTRVKLVLRSTFPFGGVTGASAVVVPPAVTGFAGNLLLLHAPRLLGESALHHRLMGLLDSGGSNLTEAWPQPIMLAQPLEFAPTVDEVSKSLFLQYKTGSTVYRYGLLSGQFLDQYDMLSIGGFAPSFLLNGHVLSNQANGIFTLLLSGASSGTTAPTTGQFVMGFRPLVAAGQLLWSMKIADAPDDLTEAWATSPSTHPGVDCPIVVGSASGISRVCD